MSYESRRKKRAYFGAAGSPSQYRIRHDLEGKWRPDPQRALAQAKRWREPVADISIVCSNGLKASLEELEKRIDRRRTKLTRAKKRMERQRTKLTRAHRGVQPRAGGGLPGRDLCG